MADVTLYLTQRRAANLLKVLAAWHQPGALVAWTPELREDLQEVMVTLTEKLQRRIYRG
ncbi:MAG: hypothetical protein GY906_22910 [bacterium]|nr:hypothetical protein [bacterium]